MRNVAKLMRMGVLAAMCVLANAVAAGTLLLIDNAVMAEVRAARTEAVAVMQSVVPPVLPADEDAAPLYRQAFERIEIDKGLTAEQSPLKAAAAADVSTDEVTALLARHATTLDLLRRAAAKPGNPRRDPSPDHRQGCRGARRPGAR